MFGTDLNREYAIAGRLLGLDELGLADLALAAVHGSFAPETTKASLAAEIRAYVSSNGLPARP
jgi:aminodeoxyfutalosine deaminase